MREESNAVSYLPSVPASETYGTQEPGAGANAATSGAGARRVLTECDARKAHGATAGGDVAAAATQTYVPVATHDC